MKDRTPEYMVNDKQIFQVFFNQRDISPEIYFDYHAGYFIPENGAIFPQPDTVEENFSDKAFFQLQVCLPISYKKYTGVEAESDFTIESAGKLLPYIKNILWYEFTERLLSTKVFTEYFRIHSYLDYHFHWYQSKGGKAEDWLKYFEHAWKNDFRITSCKQEHDTPVFSSDSLINIIQDVEQWLEGKKNDLNQNEAKILNKIKFYGTGAAFAYIFSQIVSMGHLEMPKNSHQGDNIEAFLTSLLQHFEVINPKTGQEYSISYLVNAYKDPKLSRANEASSTLKESK